MKIGIVGAGRVGSACALAAVVRGSARYIVIVDRAPKRAKAVATDLRYGSPLCPKTTIVDGDYDDLADAALVMVTAGINEKVGGATDRNDPEGRLRLLDTNAEIYREIVPHIRGRSTWRSYFGCNRSSRSSRRHRAHKRWPRSCVEHRHLLG